MSLREREFVRAARFMGVPNGTIILRHILPNVASILIIDATLNVGFAILAETGLSFLGFGVQPPDVSLGTLIADGNTAATTAESDQYYGQAQQLIQDEAAAVGLYDQTMTIAVAKNLHDVWLEKSQGEPVFEDAYFTK